MDAIKNSMSYSNLAKKRVIKVVKKGSLAQSLNKRKEEDNELMKVKNDSQDSGILEGTQDE